MVELSLLKEPLIDSAAHLRRIISRLLLAEKLNVHPVHLAFFAIAGEKICTESVPPHSIGVSLNQTRMMSLENSFFDKTVGEFSLSLCLFNKTDNYLEVPVTGYQYNVAYKITDSKIAFEIKNGAVIRNH